jgi:AcrR family transcriptional regulator
MSMTALSPIVRSKAGSKRDLILREAARSLNVRGVTDTALAAIAGKVGMTRAALYYYFEDQEDLVFQSYRHSCEVLARRLTDAAAGGRDPAETIARFIDACTDPGQPELATLCEVGYLGEERRSTIVGLYEGLIARLADILRRGAERGQMRSCDPRIAALALMGVITWIPLQARWVVSEPFSQRDLAAAAKAFILGGYAAADRRTIDYAPLDPTPASIPHHGVFDGRAMAMAKQETLLAAASWLFNLKGVDATSLDEIAARLGVTKKVIYHNIGGKAVLLTACYLRSLDFADDLIVQADAVAPTALHAFCSEVDAHVEARLRPDIAPLSGPGGLQFLPTQAVQAVSAAAARLFDTAQALYLKGQADGSLRGDVKVAASLMILPGMVEWIPKWLTAEAPEDRRAIARELGQFTAFGLRPDANRH